MKNYQEFIRYAMSCKEDYENIGVSGLNMHLKKECYKKAGITNDDVIKQLEERKTKEQFDRIELGRDLINEYGSVYEIEDDVKRYIMLNKPPQDKDIIDKLHLPFKIIFIDTEITNNDVDLDVTNIHGLMISETNMMSNKDLKKVGRIFLVHYLCNDANKYFIDEFKIDIDKSGVKIYYGDNKTMKFLRNFIMNFLMFINDPEVTLIFHKRDKIQKLKRIKRGKMPLPSSRKVRIVGRLKKYMDGIRDGLTKGKLQYRFWVRGHNRILRSPKWGRLQGRIIRIEPYLKGEGVMLRRTYSLDFEKKDIRVEELKEGVLEYDDI